MERAVFGGGCFWCIEAVFKMLRGISVVKSGYAGEPKAEVVYLEYDPKQISYHDLLTVFFASHNPTTRDRQGDDVGPQYRSVVFFTTPEQVVEAKKFVAEIGPEVVTEIAPLTNFEEAEDYHRNYYATHPGNPYCEVVINPKLEKIQRNFANLLNEKSQKFH